MTSRSYLIAGSLLFACTAPKDHTEAVEARADKAADKKAEIKAEIEKAKIEFGSEDPISDTGEEPVGPDFGGDGGTETGNGAVVIVVEQPTTKKRKTKQPKGASCPSSYVKFDGECLPKKKADYLAEKRDEKHLAELADADSELEQAKVQQQILEDQAKQMENYGDDLDEIYKKLEEKKKKGEGPFDKKGEDPFGG